MRQKFLNIQSGKRVLINVAKDIKNQTNQLKQFKMQNS